MVQTKKVTFSLPPFFYQGWVKSEDNRDSITGIGGRDSNTEPYIHTMEDCEDGAENIMQYMVLLKEHSTLIKTNWTRQQGSLNLL